MVFSNTDPTVRPSSILTPPSPSQRQLGLTRWARDHRLIRNPVQYLLDPQPL